MAARRHSEKVLPGPRRGRRRPDGDGVAYYERLMQVTVRDTYYPPPHACPDFVPAPSVASAQLMRDLGLLFQPEPAGFSILYDRNHADSLIAYLERDRNDRGESWTRLSIELALRNTYFANFTRVPNDLDPAARNFYLTNCEAHQRGRSVILNRHRYVTGRELLPVIPVQFPVPVTPSVREVRVLDISGEEVICAPRCIPANVAADVAECRHLRELSRERPADECQARVKWVCRKTIYLDFSSLREDRYTIQEIGRGGGVLREKEVLFTAPSQYCFVDLLFAQPRVSTPPATGVFPVQGLGTGKPSIVPVHYELAFKRRTTYWRYYVVLPGGRREDTLAIDTEPPGQVTFIGPCPVVIGNATPAALFVSDAPVPMKTPPPARFILTSADRTLMESMPVASIKQILPEADSSSFGGRRLQPRFRDYSDIYVYV